MKRITVHKTKAAAMRAARPDGWVAHEVAITGEWVWVAYPDTDTFVATHYGDVSAEGLALGLAALERSRRRHIDVEAVIHAALHDNGEDYPGRDADAAWYAENWGTKLQALIASF